MNYAPFKGIVIAVLKSLTFPRSELVGATNSGRLK
jgi:hypothetical protein